MAVKLVMSKAYDRVEWKFVEEIMKKMGFEAGWVKSLMKCVSTVSYSVVINGNKGEIFCPTRGLRQRDPLSPFLFLFCGEGLSSLMRIANKRKILKGVKASRSGPSIFHLLFVDDCILFTEATEEGAQALKLILKEYEIGSGQCVNYEKPTVFFSLNTQDGVIASVIGILGVRRSTDPERYLGLPNLVGRKKRAAFQVLKDRFKQRIDNWSIRHLSQGGKEIFIKAVLQSIPTYTTACFLLPKSLCIELEEIIAKFWWQKGRNKKGIHWFVWKELCSLKEDGGLGFQDLEKFNIALLAKQGWRLFNFPDSLLARVLKAKYYPQSEFFKAWLGNLPSLTWRSVWAARGLLEKGLCFRPEIARKILQIPLAELAHEDFQVWRGEMSGEFSVRSAYKLLQGTNEDPSEINLQTESKNFYRKLWKLHIPSKITLTVWRISWNFIPSLVNLKQKKVVVNAICPRFRQNEEDSYHLFQQCPGSLAKERLSRFGIFVAAYG